MCCVNPPPHICSRPCTPTQVDLPCDLLACDLDLLIALMTAPFTTAMLAATALFSCAAAAPAAGKPNIVMFLTGK